MQGVSLVPSVVIGVTPYASHPGAFPVTPQSTVLDRLYFKECASLPACPPYSKPLALCDRSTADAQIQLKAAGYRLCFGGCFVLADFPCVLVKCIQANINIPC